MPRLNINGKTVDVNAEGDTPLLWVLREQVGPDRPEVRLRRRRSAARARCTSTARFAAPARSS